jgi:23S rRNA pseudouridine2604 synthase
MTEKINFPIRINKYLAHKNYTTRRGADDLIEKGAVFINEKTAELGDYVRENDEVTVKGHQQKEFVYYAYYKPKGVVTVGAQDDQKEISDIGGFSDDIFPIGRLDKDSEGLIIMTNDGRITDFFLNPDQAHEKEYRVTVDRPLTHQAMVKLRDGVKIDVGRKKYTTKKAKVRKVDNTTLDIVITEGKNRQIRKMCGAVGYKVTKLKRFRIMDIELGGMKPGQREKIELEVN